MVCMTYFTYILKSKSATKTYVGHTNSMNRRLSEHNSDKHYYTKRYAPWEVIRIEKYDNLDEAIRREHYLKTASGRRWLSRNAFAKN